jgi:4-amino-4-deoxy-L-arabinose transferase-like glycosyltransferase
MPSEVRRWLRAVEAGWREGLVLGAILAVATVLRLLWLAQNDYGRTYYAAAVRSMLGSWHNFFFNAFDPAGFVSLDKPPVAIWLQAASAKLLGFNGLAMLLPQAIEGLIAVALVHVLVRRAFGVSAGLLAALFLALTPISVAIDRSNNTDSCLVLVLLLAVWALMRAVETGRTVFLLLAMALAGVGFNVKMGAALVLVPTLALTYLVMAPVGTPAGRIGRLGIGGIVLSVVSLSWAVAYDLVPAGSRPYVGSTQHDSMLELVLVHNGWARFARPAERSLPSSAGDEQSVSGQGAVQPVRPRLWDDSAVGPLRLLRRHQAGQVTWFLPLALAGLLLGAWRWRESQAGLRQRTSLMLWGGWLLSYWIVFSAAGGYFHTYYLVALAPPMSALAGIGIVLAWRRSRGFLLPGVLLLAAAWATYLAAGSVRWEAGHWSAWLAGSAIMAAALSSFTLFGLGQWRSRAISGQHAALAVALAALLVMPAAWALSVVLVRPNVAAPAADLAALWRPATEASDRAARMRRAERRRGQLIAYLRRQRGQERFMLAVPNALMAAPLIMATGEAVMAIGGYAGADPILAPADLQRLAERGEVRFVMLGGFSLIPADERQRAIAQWVRDHGAIVERSLWLPGVRASAALAAQGTSGGSGPFVVEPAELYDVRPRGRE